jgi:outer membrane immunogenic protein
LQHPAKFDREPANGQRRGFRKRLDFSPIILIAELSLLGPTMKHSRMIVAAAAVGAMLGISSAYAAPATAFSWTGFYIGANAGAGVLHDQGYLNFGSSGDRHGVGGLAGGQIGFNYQTGRFVFGIEGEGFWSGMKVTQDQFGFGIDPNAWFATATIKNKWDFDVAGRFGIAFDRALVYGKAGWVFGGFDWNFANRIGYSNQASDTLNGLLIGLGLEYAVTNNWTAKFEYDYLGFGAKNVKFTEACNSGCVLFNNAGFTQNVSADKHIFKLGLNYLFNAAAPVIAKY